MEYGRKVEDQLITRPTPESELLTALRKTLRDAHDLTRFEKHPVYPLGQMRGATHERRAAGPVITAFILEQAIHTTRHRRRRPLDARVAFARLDDHRVPAREDPESPLTPEAYTTIDDNIKMPRTPVWQIGSALVHELAIQHPYAVDLVEQATMAAANELVLARDMHTAA